MHVKANLPLDTGLVFDLPLCEGSGLKAYDRSRYQNHGLITGATWVNGQYGKALSFVAASSQKVTAAGNTILGSAPFTLTAWVKAASNMAGGFAGALIIGTGGSGLNGKSAYIGFNGTSFSGGLWGTHLNSAVFDTSTWHFLTLVFSGGVGGNLLFYVDNVLKESRGAVTPDITGSPILIGALTPTSYFWDGLICKTRVYNCFKSPAEIKTWFNAAR